VDCRLLGLAVPLHGADPGRRTARSGQRPAGPPGCRSLRPGRVRRRGGRDDDVFGVGYYYADVDPDRFIGIVADDFDDREQGIEAFYNLAITPATHLTFDLQWLDTPFTDLDDAVVLGLRLRTAF
jgi:hypothetical protein